MSGFCLLSWEVYSNGILKECFLEIAVLFDDYLFIKFVLKIMFLELVSIYGNSNEALK